MPPKPAPVCGQHRQHFRITQSQQPAALARAFADDTAVLIQSWKRDRLLLFSIFALFEKVSRLSLNFKKTIAIPLWTEDPQAIQARLAEEPGEPQITWASSGKYLGVHVGPGKGTRSREKPARKFEKRLEEWPWAELGLHAAISIYNTFVLSVLLFVGQVETPPDFVLRLEARAVRRIAHGPGNWCSPRDLHHARDLGQSINLRLLAVPCKAAMLRLREQEATGAGIRWRHLERALTHTKGSTMHLHGLVDWKPWFDARLPTVVETLHFNSASQGISRSRAVREVAGAPIGPLSRDNLAKFRRGYQAWCCKALLRAERFDPATRIRQRTARWRFLALPGHAAPRIARHLRRLRSLVPARARAAMLSTIFNRWTTDTRRSLRAGRNRCAFGCTCPLSDRVEHYLRCPGFRARAARRLQLRPPPATRLDEWMIASRGMGDMQLRQTAVAVYVLHRTVNHLRRASPLDDASEEYERHFMNQMLHEAARSDSRLREALRAAQVPGGRAPAKRRRSS
ncbi:unnamed protein product [Prorocentrum cordatum]|uniref:Reverse transcriptase domain-containing protein n=1 Tax=Prorocentrum cordatum TaxID=2364126 RepID=A0ABN9VQC0_9DINO|nr:unnamed protein product [Polarella glacialis]